MLEIVLRFAEQGFQIDPGAVELIESLPKPRDDLLRRLLQGLDRSIVVVSADDLRASGLLSARCDSAICSSPGSGVGLRPVIARAEKDANPGAFAPVSSVQESTCSSSVEVISDITGNSTCVGEYQDFVRYFRDRYGKIRDILSRRLNSRPIESLGKSTAGREVSVIGMVMDVRTTSKGSRVLELEDTTGMITAIFQKESPSFEQSQMVVTDEVLGITGMSDGGGRIFAKSLLWPDLPNQSQALEPSSGGAILISDLHFGSKYFMEDAWNRFLAWVNCESEDPSGLSSGLKYIVIAGDIVDGIGIYPGQEADLKVKDIYEQYEMASGYLNQIRPGINVVISPGNHDIVRQAEPQPAFPEEIQSMFSGTKSFVGSPAWISLGGTTVLVYHGRSIDDLVLKVPGLSYGEPEKAMIEMLKRRHLCPIYGNRVSIAPEGEDHYVIQKAPAILHCGHVHTVGIARYKGVAVVNSGTWQSQTDFQKKMNIQPVAAVVPHVDLATMKIRKLIFA